MAERNAARRTLAAKRINERLKLLAAWLNALSIGTIGAGVIIPATRTLSELSRTGLVWIGAGLVLHIAAHATLALLRSED